MNAMARVMFYVGKAIGPPSTLYEGFDANRVPATVTRVRKMVHTAADGDVYMRTPAELWWDWFDAAEVCR